MKWRTLSIVALLEAITWIGSAKSAEWAFTEVSLPVGEWGVRYERAVFSADSGQLAVEGDRMHGLLHPKRQQRVRIFDISEVPPRQATLELGDIDRDVWGGGNPVFTHGGKSLLTVVQRRKEDGTTIAVTNAITGEVVCELDYTPAIPIIAHVFSPDQKLLVVCGARWNDETGDDTRAIRRKGNVALWDLETRKIRFRDDCEEGYFECLAFAPDGKTLAAGGGIMTDEGPTWFLNTRGEVRLWDVASGEMVQALTNHRTPVSFVTFSPDGKTVVSPDFRWGGSVLKFWDAATGEMSDRFETDWALNNAAYSPDGRLLAIAEHRYGLTTYSHVGRLRIWDTSAKETVAVLDGFRPVASTVFSPDGGWLAASVGGVKLWKVSRVP